MLGVTSRTEHAHHADRLHSSRADRGPEHPDCKMYFVIKLPAELKGFWNTAQSSTLARRTSHDIDKLALRRCTCDPAKRPRSLQGSLTSFCIESEPARMLCFIRCLADEMSLSFSFNTPVGAVTAGGSVSERGTMATSEAIASGPGQVRMPLSLHAPAAAASGASNICRHLQCLCLLFAGRCIDGS